MAGSKKQSGARRRTVAGQDLGEPGRCGECQTRRRPVGQYAYTAKYDIWLCDRCFIGMCFAGIWLLPWKQGEAWRGNPDAGYLYPPKEPALRPRPASGESGADRAEAALAAIGPVGWEDEDDEEDRRLRLSELRRLGVAVADRFQAATTPADERPGFLRVLELLQVRMRELGG